MKEPSRGEVWLVNLDPTKGREQAGSRPALVVSVDRFNHGAADLVIACPITSKAKEIPTHVQVDPPGRRIESPQLYQMRRCALNIEGEAS